MALFLTYHHPPGQNHRSSEDGQTVVLGGLIQDDKTQSTQRVPCLGSIPLVGMLFRSMANKGIKKNLQIFITPHIIKNPEDIDVFTTGMQNRLKEDGQQPPKSQWQKPKTKQPQPKTEKPQPKTQQQQPKNEQPQPKTEKLQPKTQQQQLKSNSHSQKPISCSRKPSSRNQKTSSCNQKPNGAANI